MPFSTIHSEKTVKSSLSSLMMSWLVLVSIRHKASATWEEGTEDFSPGYWPHASICEILP